MVTEMEMQMQESGELMLRDARAMRITCAEDYANGTEVLKTIKTRQKQVKDYWAGPKKAAQKVHKDLVARETEMLKPLQDAEGIIKAAMLEYDEEVRRKQREAEEAARKAREEEAQRMAAMVESDDGTADVIADLLMAGPVETEVIAPVAEGASVRKTWKARVTDPKLVPAYADGVEIRTINMAALNALARYSKGQSTIPGVEFYEDSSLVVRT